MATVKDSDTNLWLHNKLGDSEDLWSGISSVGAQLKGDLLKNVFACFKGLHSTVKLKMLMAILHMPRRNVDEFQGELNAIIHLARSDPDQWVSIVGDILQTYPSTGSLNLDVEEEHQFVAEVLYDLRKHMSETDSNSLLPLECQYLNKNALNQLVGMQAPPIKHFTLKRKPKSAALRAELLQKSVEAAQQTKKQVGSSTVPTKNRTRKMDDTAPLRGIPKSTTGFRAAPSLPRTIPLNRRMAFNREGGTKLLDITEQPLGGANREAKKRKKQAELEAQEQAKKDKEAAQAATPDYAAAFMSPASVKPATTTNPLDKLEETAAPSYAPAASQSKPSKPPSSLLKNLEQPLSTKTARDNLQHQLQQSLEQSGFNLQNPTVTVAPTPATPTSQPPVKPPPKPTVTSPTFQQPGASVGMTPVPPTAVPVEPTPPAQVPPAAAMAGASGASGAQKKNLSLTRDQMVAAQEMFRQSNKVTRPEKALILGFMAGARDNPCPQQGDIVTIRLSENREMVPRADDLGTDEMTVDTYFEMNYATGKWRRYKKYRPL
ncbi:negative elongation factor A-like [Acanthaster planci]|uniref:Negative elongation factor A-like n=1 Tax=Acanthaster planci TaxID=133434 RepID=A0A8B7XIQ8_ACAPL|nr:negative elongation factor A-like [Acanthaster planci]